jgi:hypothetical protein
MAEEEDKARAVPEGKDTRFEFLTERICSSLKVKDEQVQRLLVGETR